MTEKTTDYDAGAPTAYKAGEVEDYYWVDCRVKLPGPRDTSSGVPRDFACPAKVQVADVIDALNLDRWTTQAFQYIWRSGRKPGESAKKELAKAAWFLQRGVELEHHWQASLCDVVAGCIEQAIARYGGTQTFALGLEQFARNLRERDLDAVQVVVDCYGNELTKAPKTSPLLKVDP